MTTTKCLVWPDCLASMRSIGGGRFVFKSPRTGGEYEVDGQVWRRLEHLEQDARARLTTWLVEQRELEGQCPTITLDAVEQANAKQALHPRERATRLLRFVAEQTTTIISTVRLGRCDWDAFARSESTEWGEVKALLTHLHNEGLIVVSDEGESLACKVTVKGHIQISDETA